MVDITLYFAPRSRALRALWLLEELGVDYRLVPLNFARGEHKTPEMLARNPMGKVPVVTVDDHPIWETPAIAAHLSDIFPEARLAPRLGTPKRADYYRWLSFGTAVMEPAFMDHMKQIDTNPSQAGWGNLASVKATLTTGLATGEWLLGKRFTGADILVGGALDWFTTWAPEAFADVEGLGAYVSRVRARPALLRAREIDAEITERQAAPAP